jgi:hypothetical protein
MKEHFRGVIWPHNDKEDIYRYVVIGMLVTNKEIKELSGNQIVLDGSSIGLSECLTNIQQKEAKIIVGDATDVLLNLKDLC